MFPAFKEWQAIVGALAAGEQTLLLRKGGIAEGRGGFRVAADRFWLFPTRFHAQQEKTKPGAAKYFPAKDDPAQVSLSSFASLEQTWFVADRAALDALDSLHLWTPATVEERFTWSRPPGLHVLLVRVHRLQQSQLLPVTAEMGGCKSWIELPLPFDAVPAQPVLSDADFNATAEGVTRILGKGENRFSSTTDGHG